MVCIFSWTKYRDIIDVFGYNLLIAVISGEMKMIL